MFEKKINDQMERLLLKDLNCRVIAIDRRYSRRKVKKRVIFVLFLEPPLDSVDAEAGIRGRDSRQGFEAVKMYCSHLFFFLYNFVF